MAMTKRLQAPCWCSSRG